MIEEFDFNSSFIYPFIRVLSINVILPFTNPFGMPVWANDNENRLQRSKEVITFFFMTFSFIENKKEFYVNNAD